MCEQTIKWSREDLRVSWGKDKKDGEYGGLRCRERNGRSARLSERQLSQAASYLSHKTSSYYHLILSIQTQ
jgi:hypothetical protein